MKVKLAQGRTEGSTFYVAQFGLLERADYWSTSTESPQHLSFRIAKRLLDVNYHGPVEVVSGSVKVPTPIRRPMPQENVDLVRTGLHAYGFKVNSGVSA